MDEQMNRTMLRLIRPQFLQMLELNPFFQIPMLGILQEFLIYCFVWHSCKFEMREPTLTPLKYVHMETKMVAMKQLQQIQ